MKQQGKSSAQNRFSASVLRNLQGAYQALDRAVCRQPWLVQGSVNVVTPKSPSANVTYTWTRKLRNKTITVALSEKQAVVFRRAMSANRRIEEALSRLRQVSQSALLVEVPGVTKRRLDVSQNEGTKTVPKRV